MHRVRILFALCAVAAVAVVALRITRLPSGRAGSTVTVTPAIAHDVSGPLNALDVAVFDVAMFDSTASGHDADADRARRVMAAEPNDGGHEAGTGVPVITTPPGSAAVDHVNVPS